LAIVLCCPSVQADSGTTQVLPTELAKLDGVLLALDARSGEVLLLTGDEELLKTSLPAGSVIKPFLLVAASREGRFDFDKQVYCSPHPIEAPPTMRCWLAEGHGIVDLPKALAQSCNVYFFEVARKTSYSGFCRTLNDFGLDVPEPGDDHISLLTGLDPALRARPGDVLCAYMALFNGGLLWSYDPGAPRSGARMTGKVDLDGVDLQAMRKGLALAVQSGTAKAVGALNPGMDAVAKTGTARYSLDGIEDVSRTHGWCIVLAPADEPKVGLVVFVREGTGFSSSAELAGRALRYLARQGLVEDSGATDTPGQ